MNIIVCIKQVPSTTRVNVDPETGILIRDGIESKMNPFDLFALETALRLKEEQKKERIDTTVKVISMGPPQAEEIIREAYMIGADEGFLLSDKNFAGADVLATAYTLFQGIKKIGKFDLIICGKQTTDGDTAQVGAEIAEFLKIPHIANVLSIMEFKKNSMLVEMDMPDTVELAGIIFPCLLTVEKNIFQPRLPSYRKKIKTKSREIKILTIDDLDDKDVNNYGLEGSPTRVEKIFPPEINTERKIWTGNSEELATRIAEKLIDLKII
jgi:electron transfer flavoprotein beta subunit